MKKLIALILSVLSVLTLAACSHITNITGENKTYEVSPAVHSLDIEVGAADFTIQQGEAFRVESNLKALSVTENDGVLTIKDETKPGIHYGNATVKLWIPQGAVLESVDITTGAAKLTADTLSAKSVGLKLGAGKVQFDTLNASSDILIAGGAGEIVIGGGTMNDPFLMLGVGKLDMTAALTGTGNLQFGVGESDLTLLGSKDDYKLEIEKGVGSINIDGKSAADFGSSGSGQNALTIKGGVGAVNIRFREN